MSRTRISLLVLTLAMFFLLPTVRAAGQVPPAADLVRSDALIVLEVADPEAVLDLVLSPALIEAIEGWKPYQAKAADPEFQQLLLLVRQLELQFQTDWKTAVRKLVGGGVTVALGPADGQLLVVVESQDAKLLAGLHQVFLMIAQGEAAKQGNLDGITPKTHRDVTYWSFGPNEAHAIVGGRFLLANGPTALEAALDLPDRAGGGSISSLPAYQQAMNAAGTDVAARLYVNTGVLKQVPKIEKALTTNLNPLVSILLAGVTESLNNSSWLAAGLTVKGSTLVMDVTTDGTIGSAGVASFALPDAPGKNVMPNLVVPRQIAGMSLYRDLPAFYTAKDDLFPERTSGLIFFENMMGIFFTGRDLTDEVLAETGPNTRLIVAEQKYDPAVGTPAVQIPAFAVVFELKDPKQFSIVAEEAWQKAIGMVNFTRGQQALPGLIIDRAFHADTKYTVAYFTPDNLEDRTGVDVRFNFRPSLATAGNYLILSSTDDLTEALIDAVHKDAERSDRPRPGTHSLLEVSGVQLASILAANRNNMVLKNMVEKGHTREQAETEIDMLLAIVRNITQAQLAVSTDKDRSKASLKLELAIPVGQDGGP